MREQISLDEAVVCPNCGGNNLHHGQVTVFDRRGEDGPTTVTELVGQHVHMHYDYMSENPSSRRDALAVDFSCENCEANLQLVIMQHKGCTYAEWCVRKKAPDIFMLFKQKA